MAGEFDGQEGWENVAALQLMRERAPDFLAILDSDLNYLWSNRAHPFLPSAQVVGKHMSALLEESHLAMVRAHADEVLGGGESQNFETQAVLNGERKLYQQRFVAIEERSGILLLVMRDITAQRFAERARLESERIAHGMLQHFPDIAMVTSPDGVVLEVNEDAARSMGVGRSELLGNLIWNFMPPEVAEIRQAFFREVIESGQPVRRQDSREGRRFDSVGYPVISEGRIGAIAIIARDITEQVKAQAMLEERRVRRWHSEKMEGLGTLAAGIAHDFNNMLTPIVVNTRLASRDDCDTGERRELLSAVSDAANRAAKLVRQILVFGRDMDMERAPHELASLVDEALGLVRASAASNIEFSLDFPEEPVLVMCDSSQIVQALLNLLINAMQAMPTGGRIEVSLDLVEPEAGSSAKVSESGHARLRVRDTGDGVSAEVMSRVFDPFFSTKLADKGSGLGLFVVHSVAENHDGFTAFDSVPGEGSEVTLFLPHYRGEERPSLSRARSPDVRNGGRKVLLLDDEDLVRNATTLALELDEHQVTSAESCAQARAIFASDPNAFDILVTDQRLGDGTGLEVALALRAQHPGLPVILCSGHLSAELREQCEALGIRTAAKPYDIDDLLGLVAKAAGPA